MHPLQCEKWPQLDLLILGTHLLKNLFIIGKAAFLLDSVIGAISVELKNFP